MVKKLIKERILEIYDDIVISSRVRLARNVRGLNFHTQLTNVEEAESITNAVYEAINEKEEFRFQRLKHLNYNECVALQERHIISRELIENKDISSYAISDDEHVIVMVCEEDHIREQCLYGGFNLLKAYDRINKLDNKIIRKLDIAFDDTLGFITASPNNLGPGMRASCMMFLPALFKHGKIEHMIDEARSKGLTVRGVFGEGSRALGYLYQISNQNSLGMTEEEIIDEVSEFVLKLCEYEDNLRGKILEESYDEIKDSSARAYGILKNAHILSEEELYKQLSELKLGVVLGLMMLKEPEELDKLYYEAGKANLLERFGDKRPENILRAEYIRDRLK